MQHLQRSHQQQRQLVSEQGQPDSAFNNWYRAVQPLLSEMSPDDVEQFVEGLTGGEPGARDLMWIARRWNEEGEAGYSRATELLSRALDLADPDDDDLRDSLRYELGGYQLTHGDYEAAAESFLRVLQSRPDHALSLNNVAYIKSKYLDEAEEALPHAQRAAELMPENASVLDTLGWVHYKLGNHSQAEDALRKSISLEETAASQLHLAYVLAAEGQFDSAITRLRRAAELQPDSQVEAEIDRLTDDIRTKRAEAR